MAGWSIVGNRYPFTYSEPPERLVLERTDYSDSVVYIPERTCRNVSDPPEGFLCSECGWGDFAEPSHLLTGSCYAGLAKGPRYCPSCGARVVE